jgi:hypothetical protein
MNSVQPAVRARRSEAGVPVETFLRFHIDTQ